MTQDSFVDAGACSVSAARTRAEDCSTPNSSGTAPVIRRQPESPTIEATEVDEFVAVELESREAAADCRSSLYEGSSGD